MRKKKTFGKVIVVGVGMSFLNCRLGDFEHGESLHLILSYDLVKDPTAINWEKNCKPGFVEKVSLSCGG